MAVKVLDVIVGHTDAIDGHVGLTNLLNGLVQRVFAEGIQAGGKQQEGFLSLDALQPVQRVQQRVKNVRLTKPRSEEHTSELQSPMYLVCRLLLEKKKKQ